MAKDKVEVLDIEGFKILKVDSKPPYLEAKILFDKDHISQKLIFTIMNITHNYGVSCSAPQFEDDSSMTFILKIFLSSFKFQKFYLKLLLTCLYNIKEFSHIFQEQLDFSQLDLSMFGNIDLDAFYPEQLAALRDQHYDGSWEEFYEAMQEEERPEEAGMIEVCMQFEEINDKDIGLVGHKLHYMLEMLDENLGNKFEVN